MAPWLVYLKERFPPATYALLIFGMALSAQPLGPEKASLLSMGVAVVALTLFFFVLRLMDEIKDMAKDQIAHPDRPLPRGLIAVASARRVIAVGLAMMTVVAFVAGILSGPVAGGLFAFVTLYLWLMFREFFFGDWLNARPLLYAVSHQLIVVLLMAFVYVLGQRSSVVSLSAWGLTLVTLGGFFAYEVSRKQDPDAHPLLKTYRQIYGAPISFVLVLAAIALSLGGAVAMNAVPVLAPVAAALLASFALMLVRPERFKMVEAWASCYLVVSVWSGVIAPWIA